VLGIDARKTENRLGKDNGSGEKRGDWSTEAWGGASQEGKVTGGKRKSKFVRGRGLTQAEGGVKWKQDSGDGSERDRMERRHSNTEKGQ